MRKDATLTTKMREWKKKRSETHWFKLWKKEYDKKFYKVLLFLSPKKLEILSFLYI